MTFDQIVTLFNGGTIVGLIVKLAFLLLIFLYAVFAGVVLRQIQLMNKIVTEDSFSPVLFTIALVHFLLVVVLFFLTMILL